MMFCPCALCVFMSNKGEAVGDASVIDHYHTTRKQSVALVEGLSAEDLCAQSMPDASPSKWHLAHTSWFFETFILQKYERNFRWHNNDFPYLFNSYYDAVGQRHARPQRGLLTRPSLTEIFAYRENIDARMQALLPGLLEENYDNIEALLTIGLHHEMQHQELLLTDLLHLFSCNPIKPAVMQTACAGTTKRMGERGSLAFQSFDGAMVNVGAAPETAGTWSGFSYDCEQPTHPHYLTPFALATRLVSNADWLAFMADGGYDNSLLWLSDGWQEKQKQGWVAPAYWERRDDQWWQFGLDGMQPIDGNAPVHHVSFYEADAFARWSGKRLPREHELECAQKDRAISGNFLESHVWRPLAGGAQGEAFDDLYGDVWEWTQSPFTAYPGFDPKQGALGEYNGKFMINQCVLKGGSCVTPRLQMRSSYRNFFYPHQRWQFTGLRLAQDC